MDTALVTYEDGLKNKITLSLEIIRRDFLPVDSEATDQEVHGFLQLCHFQKLNPYLKEAYLIKYGTAKATMVTGKETFLKRAAANPKYQGHEAGVTIVDGEMRAWAKVYVEGYQIPIYIEVDFVEYVGKKWNKDSKKYEINGMWRDKPKTMLRKVAVCQALREAFPGDLGGLYSPEEINTIDQPLPEPKGVTVNVEATTVTEEKPKRTRAKKATVQADTEPQNNVADVQVEEEPQEAAPVEAEIVETIEPEENEPEAIEEPVVDQRDMPASAEAKSAFTRGISPQQAAFIMAYCEQQHGIICENGDKSALAEFFGVITTAQLMAMQEAWEASAK